MPEDVSAASPEMACCLNGDHDCGPAMQPADCCSSPSDATQKFVATKPSAPTKPLLTACEFFLVPAQSMSAEIAGQRFFSVTISPPPLFLLISSLRI
jgi:hypothetical protein